MQFNTAFNCGDKAWCFEVDRSVQRTVGQIRIQYTESEGINGGAVEPECPVRFDNYKPKAAELEEVYMCVESGIGSGRLYTLGKHIFATKEECDAAYAKHVAEQAAQKVEWEREQRRRLLAREESVRRELAEIERAKAAA